MTEKLKAAAIEKLRGAGYEIEDDATDRDVCKGIRQLTAKARPRSQQMFDYMRAYLALREREPFVPQKAVARTWGHRPAHVPPVHLRAHEIDRLPRPIAMSGPGIGGDNGMGRGR